MTTLRYKNTLKDSLAFMRYHHTHSWSLRIIFFVFIVITLQSVVSSIPGDSSLGISIFTGVVIEALLISVFIGLMFLFSVVSMLSKRNQTIHTDHTITFDESGLTEATPYNTSVYRWTAIQKVARTKHHLFLFVAQHMAHVIPRRAVTSEDEWINLHDTILKFTQHDAPIQPENPTSADVPR